MANEEKTEPPKPWCSLKGIGALFKETFLAWRQNYPMLLAGALSYFAVFSIVPILIIIVYLLGNILGEQRAQAEILSQIQQHFDIRTANFFNGFLLTAKKSGIGIATVFSGLTLFLIASAVFEQLRSALNFVWKVDKLPKGVIKGVIGTRFLSFAMLVILGVFFFSSYLVDASLQFVRSSLGVYFPVVKGFFIWKVIFNAASLVLFTFLFGFIYRYFPQTKVRWKDVWLGAVVASVAFFAVRYIFTLPFRYGEALSFFGAAKSIMVLLLWIYFSAQVFLFGAEFTWVFANKCGSRAKPKS